MTTMKRILYRMLRYTDAIVKRGVDKLIDAIAHSAEPQTKNAETPQPQKRMRNDTNCAPQTTDNTTNCGLTKQAFTLMDEQCDMRFLLYGDMRKLPITWHLHMLSGVTLIGVVMFRYQYAKRTLSTHKVLPTVPTYAPPWLESN